MAIALAIATPGPMPTYAIILDSLVGSLIPPAALAPVGLSGWSWMHGAYALKTAESIILSVVNASPITVAYAPAREIPLHYAARLIFSKVA